MNDPQVISAIINAVGSIVSTLIAAVVASLIGKKFAKTEKLRTHLAAAVSDIAFLLRVEREHIAIHMRDTGNSNLLTARHSAKSDGYFWSGQFTPSRAGRFTDIGNGKTKN